MVNYMKVNFGTYFIFLGVFYLSVLLMYFDVPNTKTALIFMKWYRRDGMISDHLNADITCIYIYSHLC